MGHPDRGSSFPDRGAEVSACSTLPCKLPLLYRTTYRLLWGRGTINKLHAHMQELTRGVVHMRRCSVGPGICVRGRPLPFPYPSSHLAPPFPIFLPLISRAPLKQLRGLEERCKIPQRSSGRSPGRKRIWSTLKLSESHCNRFQNFEVHVLQN